MLTFLRLLLMIHMIAPLSYAACPPSSINTVVAATVPWSTLNTFTVDSDATRVFAYAVDGTLIMWNTETRKSSVILECLHSVQSLALGKDKKLLVVGSNDGTIEFISVDLPHYPRTSRKVKGSVDQILIAPNGDAMLTLQRNQLTLWNLHRRVAIWSKSASEELVRVAFSPDGTLLAITTGDSILLMDVATGRLTRRLDVQGVDIFISDLAFTRNGGWLAAGVNNDLVIFDPITGIRLRTLSGHSDQVIALTMLDDGKRAISVGEDQTLRTWDLDAGVLLSTSRLPPGLVTHDGRFLINTTSRSGEIEVWDIPSQKRLQTLTYRSPLEK